MKFIKRNGHLEPAGPDTKQWVDGLKDFSVVVLNHKDPKRTLDQNSMIHAMYNQLARAMEQTNMEITAYCKLHHGVPILRRDDEEFREMYDRVFKGNITYEEKLSAMRWLPVTRVMTKKQLSEYTDEIIADFTSQGVPIVLPGDHHGFAEAG